MSIKLADRGDYYRGLLVLIRRDRVISEQERELMIHYGESLDFDRRFCESAIDDLLINPHIKAEPIQFSDVETAKSFLRDALRLALSDGNLHPKELSWLQTIATANGLDKAWLTAQQKNMHSPNA
jgi:hypothetical protein